MAPAANGTHSAGEPGDETLMMAYRDGDASAFDMLYRRHRTWLYRTLARQLGDASRADEVFQETWYSLIRSAPGYEPRARFTTWLYLLARQRIADHWRRVDPAEQALTFNDDGEASDTDVLDALVDENADPAQHAERHAFARKLSEGIAQLPPAQREVLLLASDAAMSLDEIATATASDREAVKSRLRYARQKLALFIKEARP